MVSGCDDSTYVALMLTDEEYAFLNMVCQKVTEASQSICAPTMYMDEED